MRFEKILFILLLLSGCHSLNPIEEKAGKPIVSRADYQVPDFWKLPVICGRTYWQIYRVHSASNLKEKYPELVKLMANGGGECGTCNYQPPTYCHTGGPFFVTGLRWAVYHYADEASRTYGLRYDGKGGYVKPEISEGEKTILEKQKALSAECGGRYLGVRLDEWDEDWRHTLIIRRPPTNDNQRLIEYIKTTAGNIEVPPRSREQAVESIKAMFAVVKKTHGEPFFAMSSACLYDHYAMEFGSSIAENEICCQGCVPVRMRIASARGAARQYEKTWWSYMVNAIWAQGADMGWSSTSFFFRKIMLSYMAGCSFYEQEQCYAMRHDTNSIDYIDSLVRAEEFFARYPDRGVPYTPILLGLDWLHGTIHPETDYPFCLQLTCKQNTEQRLFLMIGKGLETLMPYRGDTPDEESSKNYKFIERDNYSLSGSSFGDVFDIMIVNPPSDSATLKKLNAYKVIVLLGEIRWTKALAKRFRDYVTAGGTLFIAADQLAASQDMGWCGIAVGDKTAESRVTCDRDGKRIDALPEGYIQLVHELASNDGIETLFADEERRPLVVRRSVGKGNVLVCMVPSMLDKEVKYHKAMMVPAARETLQMLHDQSLPFKIEGNVEFCINRRNESWVITLINNRGVYKVMTDLVAKIDEGKNAQVTITSKIPVRNATEHLAREKIEMARENNVIKKMTIIIPPGDVRIVEVSE